MDYRLQRRSLFPETIATFARSLFSTTIIFDSKTLLNFESKKYPSAGYVQIGGSVMFRCIISLILTSLFLVPSHTFAQSTNDALAKLEMITETQWKVDDCGPLLVRAGFRQNYAQIADLAYAGNLKAQIIALMYLNCDVDRDLMFGLVTSGGDTGYLAPADQTAMASGDWQDKYNRHKPLKAAICRVDVSTIRDVNARGVLCDNVLNFAKKFQYSENPRAIFEAGYEVTGALRPNSFRNVLIEKAANLGVAPAIIELARKPSSYIINYYRMNRTQQKEAVLNLYEQAIALGNGRAAGLAAYEMTSSEAFYEAMNRALSMGYWPGGTMTWAVYQRYPLPGGLFVSNSAENAIRAIEQYRLLTKIRDSHADLHADYSKILAERGSMKDNANAPPGIGLMTAIVMRELRSVNSQANVYQEVRNMLGFSTTENWNYEHGEMTIQNNDGFVSSAVRMRFSVNDLTCTKATGTKPAYNCQYYLALSGHFNFGPFGSFSQGSPVTLRKDSVEWDGKQWTSPTMRVSLLEGLQNYNPPSLSTGNSRTNGICRSLGAGLVAAGGRSTSRALDPNTWGC